LFYLLLFTINNVVKPEITNKDVRTCHVAVPPSTTSATMRCQSSLSSEALMSSVGLTLSFRESHNLFRYFSLWRLLAFFPFILSVTTKFCRLFLLNTCPRKASCRWRILLYVRCNTAC